MSSTGGGGGGVACDDQAEPDGGGGASTAGGGGGGVVLSVHADAGGAAADCSTSGASGTQSDAGLGRSSFESSIFVGSPVTQRFS